MTQIQRKHLPQLANNDRKGTEQQVRWPYVAMRHSRIQVSQVSQRAGATDRPAKEQVPDTLAWQFETQ